MTTSQLISLPVISLHEQKVVGILTNVHIRRNKITCVEVVDESDYTRYILYIKDIYSFGTKAVIVKNSSVMRLMQSEQLSLNNTYCPIGKFALTLDGNQFDRIIDIVISDKWDVVEYITASGSYNATTCLLTPDMVLVGSLKRPKLSGFKPRTAINTLRTGEQVVSIQNYVELPKREVANYNYLIGRTTTRDILNFNGEIIVHDNTKINSFVLDKVKNFGKLKELTIYSK